jgi:hypothetical protein
MNPKTLIKNVVALDTPIVFNPQTPKSINETSCKKRSIVTQFARSEKEIFFNSQNYG